MSPLRRTFSLEKLWFQLLRSKQSAQSEPNFVTEGLNHGLLYERWVADPPPLSVLKKHPQNVFQRAFWVCAGCFFKNVCRFEPPRKLQLLRWVIAIRLLKLFWACAKAELWTPRRAEAHTGRCLQQDSKKAPKHLWCSRENFIKERKVIFPIRFLSTKVLKISIKKITLMLKITPLAP